MVGARNKVVMLATKESDCPTENRSFFGEHSIYTRRRINPRDPPGLELRMTGTEILY